MKHNKRKLLIIGSLVLLLILVAAGASVGLYFVFKPKNNGKKVPGRPTNVAISQTTDEGGYQWFFTWDPPSTGSKSNLGYRMTYSGKVTKADGTTKVTATGFPFNNLTTTRFDIPKGLTDVIFSVKGVNSSGPGDWASVQGSTQKPFSLKDIYVEFSTYQGQVSSYITCTIEGVTHDDLSSGDKPTAYLSILGNGGSMVYQDDTGKKIDQKIPIEEDSSGNIYAYYLGGDVVWEGNSYTRDTLWIVTIVLKVRGVQTQISSSKIKIGE